MIANARMYSVNSETADLWRQLMGAVAERAGTSLLWYEHPEPRPMSELWRRTDLGAVFMCGLPYSRAQPPPVLVAAPVPSPAEFEDRPVYWSEFVVRTDSAYRSVEDTFGTRMALTVPDSQSGCVAALNHLLRPGRAPPFSEIIAPTITPLQGVFQCKAAPVEIPPRPLGRFRPSSRWFTQYPSSSPITSSPPQPRYSSLPAACKFTVP